MKTQTLRTLSVILLVFSLAILPTIGHAGGGSNPPGAITPTQVADLGGTFPLTPESQAKIKKMRQELIARFVERVRNTSLDELSGIKTNSEKIVAIVDCEIDNRLRLGGAETQALVNFFQKTSDQRLRLKIAGNLDGRKDLTGNMILTMGACQSNQGTDLEANLALAALARQTIATVDNTTLVANIANQPFVIRTVAIESLLTRGNSVPTDSLVTAFVHLGQQASSEPDLYNAIMGRKDLTASHNASMITALEPSGKG